jgi:hypothetical protein
MKLRKQRSPALVDSHAQARNGIQGWVEKVPPSMRGEHFSIGLGPISVK